MTTFALQTSAVIFSLIHQSLSSIKSFPRLSESSSLYSSIAISSGPGDFLLTFSMRHLALASVLRWCCVVHLSLRSDFVWFVRHFGHPSFPHMFSRSSSHIIQVFSKGFPNLFISSKCSRHISPSDCHTSLTLSVYSPHIKYVIPCSPDVFPIWSFMSFLILSHSPILCWYYPSLIPILSFMCPHHICYMV